MDRMQSDLSRSQVLPVQTSATRIGVIADVHGNIVALDAVIERLQALGVENFVFLGDLVSKGPAPQECFQAMQKLNPLIWIQGNTEERFANPWFNELFNRDPETLSPEHRNLMLQHGFAKEHLPPESVAFLANLPIQQSLQAGNFACCCVHGAPGNVYQAITSDQERGEIDEICGRFAEPWCLSGHTHIPMLRHWKGKVFINFGGVSFPSDHRIQASFGIIELGQDAPGTTFLEVPWDMNRLHRMCLERNYPLTDELKRYYGQGNENGTKYY